MEDAEFREWATRWLAAKEEGRLTPPRDMHDGPAWDNYWRAQVDVGSIDQAFADRMSSDPALPVLLGERGARSVLCAGNGLSVEPIALALMGFQVTALDISDVPAQMFGARDTESADHPLAGIPGFTFRDGIVTIEGEGEIDPAHVPGLHRTGDYPPRRGGSLRFTTGDLTDPEICPGPYDVVIQRRTLQLFPEDERFTALEHLVGRLGDPGTLVTHRHAASLKAVSSSEPMADWLTSLGLVLHGPSNAEQRRSARRLAYVRLTSG